MARGLVLVHGIGDQAQADFMLQVLNPLADWVTGASKHIVGCDALIREGVLPSKATLFIRDPSSPPGVNLAEWRVVEAYWQKAFPPPPYSAMLGWAASLAGRQVGSIVRGLGRNLTGSPVGIGRNPFCTSTISWLAWPLFSS
ncbi:MAG: hypothetical protein HY685_04805 [Chloroflexi bacterium]|nr:hypothetical protein [Chloroflexota bacterium]